MIVLDDRDGYYVDASLRAGNPTERFTVYVEYRFGPEPDDTEIEEVDVRAATDRHAREITAAALKRDYEPGGKIVHVDKIPESVILI